MLNGLCQDTKSGFTAVHQQLASITNASVPEVHPTFQSAKYNMPLPDPEAFFDFENQLEKNEEIRQNLVRKIVV